MTRRLVPVLIVVLTGCEPGSSAAPPAAPRLRVVPDSVAFHGRAGAAALPDQYLTLTLDASVSGRWRASENGSWLFVPTTSDTLPFFLPLAVRPDTLTPGRYSAAVWITRGVDAVRIPVTLNLDPAVSLSGRWVGETDSLRIALDLTQNGGAVVGWGTATPERQVTVLGTWSDPSVSLMLAAAGDSLRFTGSLVGDNALAGSIGGGGGNLALTLYRQ